MRCRRDFDDRRALRRRACTSTGQSQGARAALCRLPCDEALAHPRGEAEDPENLGRGLAAAVSGLGRQDDRANFAGHYFVATWGCGTTCVWGGIVEARSGRIVKLPSVSGWFDTHDKFEPIDFRHNSRLLVLSGARNETKGDMGRHFYVLENGKLRFLRTIKTGQNFMELNK